MFELDTRRIKKLNSLDYSTGDVVYWMQRERRSNNNWALVHAQNIAIKLKAVSYTHLTLPTNREV